MKNAMIIVVGPSGVGKSSFVDQAIADFDSLVDIVTCTTRPIREGEQPGVSYHYLSQKEFEKRREEGMFVEWAQVHGYFYGTPRDQIEEAWAQGRAVIMDIDIQGARAVKKVYPENATTIFILPPSREELRQRLAKRDGGKTVNLELRLKNSEVEMACAEEFDHRVVNADFKASYLEFKKLVEDQLERG